MRFPKLSLYLDFPLLNVKTPSIFALFRTENMRGHFLTYVNMLHPSPSHSSLAVFTDHFLHFFSSMLNTIKNQFLTFLFSILKNVFAYFYSYFFNSFET